jgi:hypothetical protein
MSAADGAVLCAAKKRWNFWAGEVSQNLNRFKSKVRWNVLQIT